MNSRENISQKVFICLALYSICYILIYSHLQSRLIIENKSKYNKNDTKILKTIELTLQRIKMRLGHI